MTRHKFIKSKPLPVLPEDKAEREAIREFLRTCPEFKRTTAKVRRKERFQWRPLSQDEKWLRDWSGHWRPGSFFVSGVGYIDSNVFLIDKVCE